MQDDHPGLAGASTQEVHRCGSCDRNFTAQTISWIDAAQTPRVKQELLRGEFNVVPCPSCGYRQFVGTPFFYEDFEEGLLVAVFPRIPEERGRVEASIRKNFGHYPVLEFFYDMTQLWTLLSLQEHYRLDRNLASLSHLGEGEQRLRRLLQFLKEDPMMIDIREKLARSLPGEAMNDQLPELLSRAICKMEEMHAWPLDRHCSCGGDLGGELLCCGKQVALDEHDRLLSRQYVVYCPTCSAPLAGASCGICSRVYTWKVGTVPSYRSNHPGKRQAPERGRGTTGL